MEYQGDKSTFQAVPLERLPRGRPVSNALRHLRRQRTPRRRSFFQVHLSRDLSFGSRHSIWNRFLDLLASWGAPGTAAQKHKRALFFTRRGRIWRFLGELGSGLSLRSLCA